MSDTVVQSSVCVENVRFRLLHSPHRQDSSEVILHTHAYVELFVCVEGELVLRSEEETRLFSGDLYLVPPGTVHGKTESRGEWFALVLSVGKRSVRDAQDLFTPLSRFCAMPHLFHGQQDLCALLREVTGPQRKTPPCLAALRVLDLLVGLCGNETDGEKETSEKAPPPTDFDLSLICRIEDRIERFYHLDLRPEKMAEEFYVSPRQFSRIIRKRYGMSFHALICQKRIRAAEKLLTETDLSVTEIASRVGFSSRESFHRAFRRIVGVSPAAVRASRANEDTSPKKK